MSQYIDTKLQERANGLLIMQEKLQATQLKTFDRSNYAKVLGYMRSMIPSSTKEYYGPKGRKPRSRL